MGILEDILRPVDMAGHTWGTDLLLVLLVAYIVGQLNAWCYRWTHAGLSYSRSFTHALVLISIVAALSMSLVASRALVAIALLGAAAIIRFRTAVRDARDTAYVFLALICGMGAGFGYLATVIVGAVLANAVALALHVGRFGAWYTGDGLLRFEIPAADVDHPGVADLLQRFCRRAAVLSVDETQAPGPDSPARCECVYKVRLRSAERGADLVAELRAIPGLSAVHLLVERECEDVA
jgi:hypothetical protein